MSSFNEYFKNQGIKIMVDRYFSGADMYDNFNKITSLNYFIENEDDKLSTSYYVENGLTATYKVRLEYTINDDPTIRISRFEVPKEVEGTFIIDGALRVSTNNLASDYDCRIQMAGSGNHIINFDYNRRYDINHKVLKIKVQKPGSRLAQEINIKYENLDSVTDDETKELLKLTEEQIKKFQIKLDIDYTPEYITTRLIDDCIAFGDDRDKDLVIDKCFESVATSFMRYLFKSNNCRNYYSIRSQITNYFGRQHKLQEQVNCISTITKNFFKGSSESSSKDTGIMVPVGINAMNLDSVNSKIVIPETVAFNATMADLIDLADTPNNQNVNIINYLTVSTHITDEGVLFDVFDKEFNKITIKYIDYLNSKVVASEYVDYDNKKLKPNAEGEVQVKYRMKRKMVKVDEIQLIDLHPDYRLSSSSRRIPFINSTDSVRISMGCGMLRQSVPLAKAQRPLVDTGNVEELENNTLNEKFKYPSGKVTKIDERAVTITLPDGTDVEVLRKTALQGVNDVDIYTEPKVKVGQKVKKDDIITGEVGMTKDTYKMGLNALVLFHAYHGLVNEDALVISESFAQRIAYYSLIDLSINIKTTSAIKWIAPIGTKVKSGDSILTYLQAIKLNDINEAINEKLGGLFEGNLSDYTRELKFKVPNNIEEAWVSDVIIQENKKPVISKQVKAPDYRFSHTSKKVIDDYNQTMDRKIIYDKFPEYVASDRLRPTVMNPKEYKIVYNVRIRLIKKTIGMVGAKITNRYGGKGVVSVVKPDEMMPIMIDKTTGEQHRVEVVMNPFSTINRKIAGVLQEQSLGNIAHTIHKKVDTLKNSKTGQKQIMPLVQKYYPGRFDDMTLEEFLKLHNSKPIEDVYYFNVGCYPRYYTSEKINEMLTELDVDTQSEILMPTEEITDMDELKANLSPEEYDSLVKDISGKFTKVDKKLQCGWMTLELLYHNPSYSCKVTSSMFNIDINAKHDEPIMGQSKYRVTGQKISEADLWVLLCRNAKSFINVSREGVVQENNQIFLNNLLGLGLTISDSKGYNQGGSDLKRQMDSMKKKFRLKETK